MRVIRVSKNARLSVSVYARYPIRREQGLISLKKGVYT